MGAPASPRAAPGTPSKAKNTDKITTPTQTVPPVSTAEWAAGKGPGTEGFEPPRRKGLTHSQQIRHWQRAATLIQQYAGTQWQAAQRSKWLLNVVGHIDADYAETLTKQAALIEHLQRQNQQLQQSNTGALGVSQCRVAELEDQVQRQETQLRECAATILDLQARLADGEAALAMAQTAAQAAAAEMDYLQQTAHSMSEHDVRARKLMANRMHELKQTLRVTQTRLRESTEAGRRHTAEIKTVQRLKEEELAHERTRLNTQFISKVAAIHAVERAAAQAEVARVRMELEAYKEPWMQQHGRRSPTKNPELTRALGLIPSSGHTLQPRT